MNVLSLLYKLETVEEKMANFYLQCHKKFENFSPNASITFYRLYIEEKNHLSFIRYQKRIVWQNQKIFEDVKIMTQEVDSLINKIDEAIEKVESLNLEEAIELAIKLENEANEQHLKKHLLNSNKKFAVFLEKLGNDDIEHKKLLLGLKKIRDFGTKMELFCDVGNEIYEFILRK